MVKQAIILAGGKSTRTYPLTLTRPKPLLKIANKTILEHTLDQLDNLVNEVIIVVNHKKEIIQKQFNGKYKSLILKYVVQDEPKGTAHAVAKVEKYIKTNEPFIILGGDDVFFREDIQACLKFPRFPLVILASKVQNPQTYGVISVKSKKLLQAIEEKPLQPKSNLVNTGMYIMDSALFEYINKLKLSKRNEYELVEALNIMVKEKEVVVVQAKQWIPITYSWNLLNADECLLGKLKTQIKGTVEKGATLKGTVIVGKGTLIKAGSYIEGPVVIGENCVIGPNCYIRPFTSIGNKCKVGNAVEIKGTILFDRVHIGHLSYIGDSVLGENVNLGAGTITANLRHDNENVKSEVNGQLIDTGRRKLGTIMGDEVHTGIHTSIYPGRKLWPKVSTLPGEVVQKDKVE